MWLVLGNTLVYLINVLHKLLFFENFRAIWYFQILHVLVWLVGPRIYFKYSSLSNKRAAQLINFLKNSSLHSLIPSCTFINFWKFSRKFVFHSTNFLKIPTCTALFHPARLLILKNFPACTFIPSCTIIR